MAMKISKRVPPEQARDSSGAQYFALIREMRAAGPEADVQALRRRFVEFTTRYRHVSQEQAQEMWAALRRRPELLPQEPPSKPASDE